MLPLLAALAGCSASSDDATPVATQTIVVPGPWVFEPRAAEVRAGEPVTFRNDGGGTHTVTFEGLPIDATLAPGATFTHTFDAPGTYAYKCKLHPPDMRGTVIVVAP